MRGVSANGVSVVFPQTSTLRVDYETNPMLRT